MFDPTFNPALHNNPPDKASTIVVRSIEQPSNRSAYTGPQQAIRKTKHRRRQRGLPDFLEQVDSMDVDNDIEWRKENVPPPQPKFSRYGREIKQTAPGADYRTLGRGW